MNPIPKRLRYTLNELFQKLWVRVTLFSLLAVAAAVLSATVGRFIPNAPEITLASGAVDDILNILATSMLTVTTFSVSIMITAYGSATSNATPRSIRLLAADPLAQNALATFIGSFLFSIVGIIGIAAGLYGDQGRIFLFLATLIVIAVITLTLLRWINQLNSFGRIPDIVARIERAASRAAVETGQMPGFGARLGPAPGDLSGWHAVRAESSAYLRYMDVAALQGVANRWDVTVDVTRKPGAFVHSGEVLCLTSAPVEDAAPLLACFKMGPQRDFTQDLDYGLIVLSEVASKALSPGINDAGTAIEAIRAATRVLRRYHDARSTPAAPVADQVYIRPLDEAETYRQFFGPIARDGAALIEVQLVLQDALTALASLGGGEIAQAEAQAALDRAWPKLSERDRQVLLDCAPDDIRPARAEVVG